MGLVTGMYNRYGERVREGIGWMGDLGSGNGSPGSLQGPEDSSGNTVPDYEPGNGQIVNDTSSGTSAGTGNSKGNNGVGNGDGGGKENNRGNGGKDKVSVLSVYSEPTTDVPVTTDDVASGTSELDSLLTTTDEEPTADITTDLVKENPFRYAGYYWDRKTQYYYLQARYYDPRPARFISEDTYEGEIENPQSLNQYVYAENNPRNLVDPTGHYVTQSAGVGGNLDITQLTLGAVRNLYSDRLKAFKLDNSETGFYLAQQYFLVWYYGTDVNDRLGEASLNYNSYLLLKLNDLRKNGKDLSKLKVSEVDKMSTDIARIGNTVDLAVGLYAVSKDYGYTKGAGKLTIPQGLTSKQFNNASSIIRKKVGSISNDIVVQGSRANGTARPDSDIDFAVRVPPKKFDELITQKFGTPNPGSAKEKTMLHAIKTGKIQSGEAGLRGLRQELQEALGMDVDISIVKSGGPFDNGTQIPLP